MPGLRQGVCRADGTMLHTEIHSSPVETPPTTPNMLWNTHSFGPIQETMHILQYQAKGAHLNMVDVS